MVGGAWLALGAWVGCGAGGLKRRLRRSGAFRGSGRGCRQIGFDGGGVEMYRFGGGAGRGGLGRMDRLLDWVWRLGKKCLEDHEGMSFWRGREEEGE